MPCSALSSSGVPSAVASSQHSTVTFSSAPRSVARRSGVPIQHSAPVASIAARASSRRVVMRTACPSAIIASARRRPRQPPATISTRATARSVTPATLE